MALLSLFLTSRLRVDEALWTEWIFFHLSIAILYSYLFIWFIVVSEKINEKE